MGSTSQTYHLALFDNGFHEQNVVTSKRYELRQRGTKSAGSSEEVDTDRGCIVFENLLGQEGILRITNETNGPLQLETHCLNPGEKADVVLPAPLCWREGYCVAFTPVSETAMIQGCSTWSGNWIGATSCDSSHEDGVDRSVVMKSVRRSPSPDTLASWFRTMASIQRHAASTEDFQRHAVRAIVQPGGLDAGMILERGDDGRWKTRSSHFADPPVGMTFEPALVELVARRREPLVLDSEHARLDGEHGAAALAAPVFDANMEVIAVLYGSRHQTGKNRRHQIRQLEALWIQLLSEAITAGYARMEHEARAARQQVLLEQAFPADVVRQLSNRSTLELPAEKKVVSLMFADLIDSSSLCEGNTPEVVVEFLSEVMDSMTDVIYRCGGVVVDYYGDGVIAMWNAPVDQPDHAKLACEASLEIQRQRTAINGRWENRLGRTCQIGIGIHTGTVIVGNSGSRHRLKYGPRGLAVNLASRIEKATRKLGQSILLSDATREHLSPDVSAHRLGEFKLRGIERPVVLHALFSMNENETANSCCVAKHLEVMQLIEKGDFTGAVERLESCTGCTLDELSLEFIKQQLDSLPNEASAVANAIGPVFNLTN